MTSRPKYLTHRPESQDAHAGDVLSQLIDSAHLTTWLYGHLELAKPWALRFLEQRNLATLYVISRGGAQLEMAHQKAPLDLLAGDLVLIPHGAEHVLRDGKGGRLHVLGEGECRRSSVHAPIRLGGEGARTTLIACSFRFGPGRRALLFERLPPVIHISAATPGQTPWLAATVQLLISESTGQRPAAAVVMSRLVDVIFVQALRTFIDTEQCASHSLCAIADPHLGGVLQAVHEQPAHGWTVAALAKKAGMSRSAFAARFTAIVGEPPLEYVARWRMLKAGELLREEHFSMLEVAERVGYGSEAAFNRAFKRWEGTTPAAFRRQNLNPRREG